MAAQVAFWVANSAATWLGLAEGSAWAAGIYYAAYAGVSYGLLTGASRLAAKGVNESGKFQARELLIRSGKAPETVVYGQSWVGGVLAYANQKHATSTKDNFEVYMVVAHAAHEVEDIIEMYYDNDLVAAANIDWTDKRVESGKYYILNDGVYAVQLSKHLGTSTQTAPALLTGAAAPISTDWTSAHRARGRALTCHVFTYFSTTSNNPDALFGGGVPTNIRAHVKGKKIYDPRLDSTNGGSGSHRFATPSTWAWSENPILCYTDYRTQYMGVAFARMDWDWVRAQADICDALVIVPPASSPTTRQKRYTCNGVIALTNTHKENCDAILSSCIGTCPKVSGKWRPTAGAYINSDVTITEDDIVGEIKMIASVQREDRYNTVNAVYYSPSDFAQEIDALPMTSATYISRDAGATLNKSIALPFTNTEPQAQRIAYKWLLQSDRQISCVVPLRWTGLKVAIGTRVSLNYAKFGWVGKTFRCTNWQLGGESPISVVLREDDSGAWADPAIGEYSTRDAQGVVTPGTVTFPTPTAGGGDSGESSARNSNFELGPWYWQYNDQIGQWGYAHQGTWSARVSGAAGSEANRNDIQYPCKEGDVFTFGGWGSTDVDWVGTSVGWRVAWLDSAGAEISTSATNQIVSAPLGWVPMIGKAYAPATANFVRLEYVWISQTAGNAYLDDGFLWKGLSDVDTRDANPQSIIAGSSVESAGPVTVDGTEGYKVIQTITVDPGVATNSDSFLEISLAFEFSVDVTAPQQYSILVYVDGVYIASTFRADYLDGNIAWPATRSYFWLVDVPNASATYEARLAKVTSNGKTFSLVNVFMSGKVLKKAQ